eukprot:935384_1
MNIMFKQPFMVWLASVACAYDAAYPHDCDVAKINGVYLDDSSNNSIVIEETGICNYTTSPYNFTCFTACFTYPGFRIYDNDNNQSFGQEQPLYYSYCIAGYPHTIIGNNTNITFKAGDQVSLTIELWTDFYETLICQYQYNGQINYKNGSFKPLECKIGGCSGELCLLIPSDIGSLCWFLCEFTCVQYQTCALNDQRICEWQTNIGQELDYQNCMTTCATPTTAPTVWP